MTELCRLATKYGTDKIYYTPFYSMLLEDKRESTNVLEIGIGTPEAMKHVPDYMPGASLRMWRDYFPYAFIYGIDKAPSVHVDYGDRICTICADQTQVDAALIRPLGPFDLIVDDGSHEAKDQLIALNKLLPLCRGLYIVEDAHPDLLPMLDVHSVAYTYAQVKLDWTALTGHCVVIRGKY